MTDPLKLIYERYCKRHEEFDHNRVFHRQKLIEKLREENYDTEVILWVANSSEDPIPPINFNIWLESVLYLKNITSRCL